MPSVPAACGSSTRRPGPDGRHGAGGRRLGGEAGERRPAPSRRPPMVSARGERAHRVDEPAPGAHRGRGARQQLALERGELVDRVRAQAPACLGSAPQHAEPGARRVERAPGRSARPRTAARGRRPRPGATVPQPETARRVGDEPRRAAGVHVERDDRGRRRRIPSASAVALPPGAAPISRTRSPALRVDERGDGLAGLVLGRRPAVAHRRQRGRVAGAAARRARRRRARRGSTWRPRPSSSAATRAGGRRGAGSAAA